jgi:hypothetical protein
MHKIPDDILAQFDAVLIKGRFLLPATQITRSGSCTILISEASIRFRIPNRTMCAYLLKNCERRTRHSNSKNRRRMPFFSSLSRRSQGQRLRRQRRYSLLFLMLNNRTLYLNKRLPYLRNQPEVITMSPDIELR